MALPTAASTASASPQLAQAPPGLGTQQQVVAFRQHNAVVPLHCNAGGSGVAHAMFKGGRKAIA